MFGPHRLSSWFGSLRFFINATGLNMAPNSTTQIGGDVPHLSGRMGNSAGPIGPENLSHQNRFPKCVHSCVLLYLSSLALF
jgi:hypothetical protein